MNDSVIMTSGISSVLIQYYQNKILDNVLIINYYKMHNNFKQPTNTLITEYAISLYTGQHSKQVNTVNR